MLLHSHGFPFLCYGCNRQHNSLLGQPEQIHENQLEANPTGTLSFPDMEGKEQLEGQWEEVGLAVPTSKRIPQTFVFFLTSSWATWAAFWSASLSWKKKKERGVVRKNKRVTLLNYSYSLTYWAWQVDAHTNTIPSSPNTLSYLNTYLTTQHQTVISASQLSFALLCLQGHTTKHCPPCCPPSQRWTLACHTSGLTTLTSDHL